MTNYAGGVQIGNICMVVCCLFYLVWWSITFNPSKKFPMAPKVVLFLCTLAAGLAGVAYLVWGMGQLPDARTTIPNAAIVVGAVVVYIALLLITNLLMHRQVTTELALIVGWTAVELCLVNSLYGAEVFGAGLAVGTAIFIVVCAVVGMACYLAYYRLEPVPAFYDGMVPLILFAVAETVMVILVWWCLR